MKGDISTKHLILIVIAALAAVTVYYVGQLMVEDAMANALDTAAR